MDFIDRINELAGRIPNQLEHISTEEATKSAMIMPFIAALGYDVFNPTEVTPELTADVGVKKGEKVDYAILQDGKPILLFECKWHGYNLDKAHASQLFRYFSVTNARFAVLTNGIIYRFYTDLEAPNKMDSRHFFEFNMLDFTERQVEELKKFTKSSYNLENILSTASDLKYTRAIKDIIAEEVREPSDNFIKMIVSQVYSGRFTKNVKDEFSGIVKKAFQQYINERINQRLESALVGEQSSKPVENTENAVIVSDEEVIEEVIGAPIVETTDEEIEGYYIVKSILREKVDVGRIVMRDVKSYCGILLDDNNRKPICRLRFNGSQKYIGLFDADKNENTEPINELDEIYKYADQLRKTIDFYE